MGTKRHKLTRKEIYQELSQEQDKLNEFQKGALQIHPIELSDTGQEEYFLYCNLNEHSGPLGKRKAKRCSRKRCEYLQIYKEEKTYQMDTTINCPHQTPQEGRLEQNLQKIIPVLPLIDERGKYYAICPKGLLGEEIFENCNGCNQYKIYRRTRSLI